MVTTDIALPNTFVRHVDNYDDSFLAHLDDGCLTSSIQILPFVGVWPPIIRVLSVFVSFALIQLN